MSVSPMPESILGHLYIQHLNLKVVRHLASSATENSNEEGLDYYKQELSTFVFVCVKIYLTM